MLINNINGEELKTMLKESRNGAGFEETFQERNLRFIYMKREIASYTNMPIFTALEGLGCIHHLEGTSIPFVDTTFMA
jgi:hypothetical protein